MLVQELFEASGLTYDKETKNVMGSTAEWMKALGADKADIKAAHTKAKSLPSYKKLVAMMSDITTDKQAANGTFNFAKPGAERGDKYMVYATGQIRSQSNDAPTRLVSPKPHGKMGDPVGSIVMFLDKAFVELAKKASNRAKVSGLEKGTRE